MLVIKTSLSASNNRDHQRAKGKGENEKKKTDLLILNHLPTVGCCVRRLVHCLRFFALFLFVWAENGLHLFVLIFFV